MNTIFLRRMTLALAATGVLALGGDPARLGNSIRAAEAPRAGALPHFTEEREAAALQFARKHAPDLLPILDKLKDADATKYREEVCEIFQVTEFLNEIRAADTKRYDLELDIWKTETKALMAAVKLANAGEEEQAKLKEELQEHAKKLIDLDRQVLKHRVEELEKELGQARDELSRAEEKRDDLSKDRFQKLLEQAKKRRRTM